MYALPSDGNVAQAVMTARLREFPRASGFLTFKGMAKSHRERTQEMRGKYILLTDSDLAYFGQLGVFGHEGSLPSTVPLLPLIGRRRIRQMGKAGLGFELIYDRDPKVLNGLFIILAEDAS